MDDQKYYHSDVYFQSDNEEAIRAYRYLKKIGKRKSAFIIRLMSFYFENILRLDPDNLTPDQAISAAQLYLLGPTPLLSSFALENCPTSIHGEYSQKVSQAESSPSPSVTKIIKDTSRQKAADFTQAPVSDNKDPNTINSSPNDEILSTESDSEPVDMDLLAGLSVFM